MTATPAAPLPEIPEAVENAIRLLFERNEACDIEPLRDTIRAALAPLARLRERHEKLRQAVRDGWGCDHLKPWQECECEDCALLRDDEMEKQP